MRGSDRLTLTLELARADMAMYAAKQAGGDTIRRWTDTLPRDLAPEARSGAPRA